MNLQKTILENFNYLKQNIEEFSLGYKIARYITNKVELLAYSTRTKDFLFFVDENKVENFISVYEAVDKSDNSKGIVIEFIIGEDKQKEIIFVEKDKLSIITESKWGKIVDTTIITNEYKIENILCLIQSDLKYIKRKVDKYKHKLKYKGYLNKQVSEKVIDNFKLNFLSNQLKTS